MSIFHTNSRSMAEAAAKDAAAPDSAPPRSVWRDWRTLGHLIGPLLRGAFVAVLPFELLCILGLGGVPALMFWEYQSFKETRQPLLSALRVGVFVGVLYLAAIAPFKYPDRPWTPNAEVAYPEESVQEIFEMLGTRLRSGGVTFQFPEFTPYDAVVLPVDGLSVREAMERLERQTGLAAHVRYECGNGQTLLWGHSGGCTILFKAAPGDLAAAVDRATEQRAATPIDTATSK